ncbi:MAG: ester cyclase [Thermoleophilaceae bacterium]
MVEPKSGGGSKPTGTGAAPKKRAGSAAAAAKKPAKRAASKPAAKSAAAKSAAAKKPAAKPSRAPAKRKVVSDTARGYFDALAARDAAAAAGHWRADGVDDVVPLGIFRGPAAIKGLYEELFAAMPDLRITVERVTADDRTAAVQWRQVGTFSAGSFQGLEPNGRRVELRGTDCLEIEDGEIVRNTSVFDGAAFARQVGLLPPEDSGADRAIRAGFNTVTKLRRTVARRTGG